MHHLDGFCRLSKPTRFSSLPTANFAFDARLAAQIRWGSYRELDAHGTGLPGLVDDNRQVK